MLYRLCDLKQGQRGTVKELWSEGGIRRRLLDIGLVEGTVVECVGCSPSGDPKAFLIRGAVIAIRVEDSRNIIMITVHSVTSNTLRDAHKSLKT